MTQPQEIASIGITTQPRTPQLTKIANTDGECILVEASRIKLVSGQQTDPTGPVTGIRIDFIDGGFVCYEGFSVDDVDRALNDAGQSTEVVRKPNMVAVSAVMLKAFAEAPKGKDLNFGLAVPTKADADMLVDLVDAGVNAINKVIPDCFTDYRVLVADVIDGKHVPINFALTKA